ncbi:MULTISPECIES: hypothetical protein [Streptomyces]
MSSTPHQLVVAALDRPADATEDQHAAFAAPLPTGLRRPRADRH